MPELLGFAPVENNSGGGTLKTRSPLVAVMITLFLGGSIPLSALACDAPAPPQKPTAEAEAARKAVRARLARCRLHPETCRQQPPKAQSDVSSL